jgi:quercetin dioxygenase-like cupin family protein
VGTDHLVPFDEAKWLDVGDGVRLAPLRAEPDGAGTAYLHFDAGGTSAPHRHPGGEDLYVISGRLRVGDRILGPRDFLHTVPGGVHDAEALEESLALVSVPEPIQFVEHSEAPGAEARPDTGALLERYSAAFATKDLDAITALHSPDGSFWLHLDEAPVRGRAAIGERFAAVFALWPELDFVTHRTLLGPDFWVLDWSILVSPALGVDRMGIDCLDLVTVDEAGLVARKDTFVDGTQLAAALDAQVEPRTAALDR